MTLKKELSWRRKQRRVRKKVVGSPERPRLCVSKSNRYLSAQLIDDVRRVTLVAASTKESSGTPAGGAPVGGGKTLESAKRLGALIAERAKAKQVEQVVFDRNGYIYHGRVKAVADAAREAGLKF